MEGLSQRASKSAPWRPHNDMGLSCQTLHFTTSKQVTQVGQPERTPCPAVGHQLLGSLLIYTGGQTTLSGGLGVN